MCCGLREKGKNLRLAQPENLELMYKKGGPIAG